MKVSETLLLVYNTQRVTIYRYRQCFAGKEVKIYNKHVGTLKQHLQTSFKPPPGRK